MTTPLPPIYRDCRRVLVQTEDMVWRFSRYHKYTVGTDLRQAAMAIMRTVNQAVHDKHRQISHVQTQAATLASRQRAAQVAAGATPPLTGAGDGADSAGSQPAPLAPAHPASLSGCAALSHNTNRNNNNAVRLVRASLWRAVCKHP